MANQDTDFTPHFIGRKVRDYVASRHGVYGVAVLQAICDRADSKEWADEAKTVRNPRYLTCQGAGHEGLAHDLKCSRPTVAKTVKALEEDGFIRTLNRGALGRSHVWKLNRDRFAEAVASWNDRNADRKAAGIRGNYTVREVTSGDVDRLLSEFFYAFPDAPREGQEGKARQLLERYHVSEVVEVLWREVDKDTPITSLDYLRLPLLAEWGGEDTAAD